MFPFPAPILVVYPACLDTYDYAVGWHVRLCKSVAQLFILSLLYQSFVCATCIAKMSILFLIGLLIWSWGRMLQTILFKVCSSNCILISVSTIIVPLPQIFNLLTVVSSIPVPSVPLMIPLTLHTWCFDCYLFGWIWLVHCRQFCFLIFLASVSQH